MLLSLLCARLEVSSKVLTIALGRDAPTFRRNVLPLRYRICYVSCRHVCVTFRVCISQTQRDSVLKSRLVAVVGFEPRSCRTRQPWVESGRVWRSSDYCWCCVRAANGNWTLRDTHSRPCRLDEGVLSK
jgi:hypothetical protein